LTEMFERLGGDWRALATTWGIKPDAVLEFVSAPMGDLHNNGRSVYQLRFSDGQSVFYKPRAVDAEHAFACVIDYLVRHGCQPVLQACRVLPGQGYGWSKYVPWIWCRNRDDASKFYERQGAFLALFWLLCGDDATSDNVVVHRDHPVWVDTECMCGPEILFANARKSQIPAWIQDSLLTTGMVFSGRVPGMSPRILTGLYLSCAVRRSDVFSSQDVLRTRYVQDVVRGFECVYSWLLAHRDAIEDEDGILAVWDGCPMRILLRPTMLYGALVVLWSLAREARGDDVARDVRELLASGGDSGGAAGPWPEGIVRQEMDAIMRGDIPFWTISTSSVEAREACGLRMERMGAISGIERIRLRARRMSAQDMARQAWLLGAFLGGTAAR
jgi:lantibiotic modifying enzyme